MAAKGSKFKGGVNDQQRKISANTRSTKKDSTHPIVTICNVCSEICIDSPKEEEEFSIMCDFCNKWIHRICTNLTPSEYKVMTKNENITFSCDNCLENKGNTSSELREIKEMIEANHKDNKLMIKKLEEDILSKVDKAVDEKLKNHNEKYEQKYDKLDQMIKELKETECNLDKNFEVQVKKYLDNKEERELKKNNIIIHKLPETQDNEQDQNEKDKSDIVKILETTNPELKAEIQSLTQNSKMIKRLGIKKANATRPRPLLIILPDEDLKKAIFRGCKNLKKSPFKDISVQDDLTKEQQEKNFQLRRELKERKEAGEKVCLFRGQIIQESEHPANKRKD